MSRVKALQKPRLVIFSARGKGSFSPAQSRQLERVAQVRFIKAAQPLSPAAWLEACADAQIAALTPRSTPTLNAKILKKVPDLKSVVIPTTGSEWLAVKILRQHSISISHVPNFSSASTAEFTWAILLAYLRKIPELVTRQHDPSLKSPMGFELAHKTLGIIGLGHIGSYVAHIGLAFKMKVIAYDPQRKIFPSKVQKKSLTQVLRASDIVCLHCPLNEQSHHMINRETLLAFKKNAILVNTARPDLVNLNQLRQRLKQNQLGAYLFDRGYWTQARASAKTLPEKLWAFPHLSWYTREAVARENQMWVEEIIRTVQGRPKNRLA